MDICIHEFSLRSPFLIIHLFSVVLVVCLCGCAFVQYEQLVRVHKTTNKSQAITHYEHFILETYRQFCTMNAHQTNIIYHNIIETKSSNLMEQWHIRLMTIQIVRFLLLFTAFHSMPSDRWIDENLPLSPSSFLSLFLSLSSFLSVRPFQLNLIFGALFSFSHTHTENRIRYISIANARNTQCWPNHIVAFIFTHTQHHISFDEHVYRLELEPFHIS